MEADKIIASYCPPAVLAAYDAGEAIMEIYAGTDFDVQYKSDKSPLTAADKASNALIMERLQALWDIPVLSEESKEVPYEVRREWDLFWLVDPLDGTKEFIKRNGEFTVNIALIEHEKPVLGIVYAPVLGTMYLGAAGLGARKAQRGIDFSDRDGLAEALSHCDDFPTLPLQQPPRNFRVVASRSHCNEETQTFIDTLSGKSRRPLELVSKGSSLKLCMVAEGDADVYPRLAPTMEWDTGAAQAVAEAAGCQVFDHSAGTPLKYNKPCLTNPFFTVYAPGWPIQLEQ